MTKIGPGPQKTINRLNISAASPIATLLVAPPCYPRYYRSKPISLGCPHFKRTETARSLRVRRLVAHRGFRPADSKKVEHRTVGTFAASPTIAPHFGIRTIVNSHCISRRFKRGGSGRAIRPHPSACAALGEMPAIKSGFRVTRRVDSTPSHPEARLGSSPSR